MIEVATAFLVEATETEGGAGRPDGWKLFYTLESARAFLEEQNGKPRSSFFRAYTTWGWPLKIAVRADLWNLLAANPTGLWGRGNQSPGVHHVYGLNDLQVSTNPTKMAEDDATALVATFLSHAGSCIQDTLKIEIDGVSLTYVKNGQYKVQGKRDASTYSSPQDAIRNFVLLWRPWQ